MGAGTLDGPLSCVWLGCAGGRARPGGGTLPVSIHVYFYCQLQAPMFAFLLLHPHFAEGPVFLADWDGQNSHGHSLGLRQRHQHGGEAGRLEGAHHVIILATPSLVESALPWVAQRDIIHSQGGVKNMPSLPEVHKQVADHDFLWTRWPAGVGHTWIMEHQRRLFLAWCL